jgi:hypothetical protein
MGVSDKKTIPEQKKIIKEFFKDMDVKKIAFLGTSQAHLKKNLSCYLYLQNE